MHNARTKDRAIGRWKAILPQLGVEQRFLSPKHGPCPICGGKDRFRFDDKDGQGTWHCNQCGAGSGISLVMKVLRIEYVDACKRVDPLIPGATVNMPARRSRRACVGEHPDWKRGIPLSGHCEASRYLMSRGLDLSSRGWPSQLRLMPGATYWHEDKTKTVHPAMISHFMAPDNTGSTTHLTYLTTSGEKASLPQVRKIAPGIIPRGGAVRLAPAADWLGVAEGIETALSVWLLYGVPTWSTLSTSGMVNWEPPEGITEVVIFGDNDRNFAGQSAAYALAYKLSGKGIDVDVKIPETAGEDWNDVLKRVFKRKV